MNVSLTLSSSWHDPEAFGAAEQMELLADCRSNGDPGLRQRSG
jgi:hypothetical protein